MATYEVPPTSDLKIDLDLLSASEREVYELVLQGLTKAQIADKLVKSIGTVKTQVRAARAKLNQGVTSSTPGGTSPSAEAIPVIVEPQSTVETPMQTEVVEAQFKEVPPDPFVQIAELKEQIRELKERIPAPTGFVLIGEPKTVSETKSPRREIVVRTPQVDLPPPKKTLYIGARFILQYYILGGLSSLLLPDWLRLVVGVPLTISFFFSYVVPALRNSKSANKLGDEELGEIKVSYFMLGVAMATAASFGATIWDVYITPNVATIANSLMQLWSILLRVG